VPPAPSTTQTFEPKVSPTYKIRTMAGDLEAVKKGSAPSAMPVTIDLPKEPIVKETVEQPKIEIKPKQELQISAPAPAKDYKFQEKKLVPQETRRENIAIKPSFPKIAFKKTEQKAKEEPIEEKSGFFGWLKKKDEVKITPDEKPKIKITQSPVPIKNEIIPSEKPLIPPRPLTPPKIQPFSSPINNPIIPKQKMEPQQQTTSAPPPGLPTMQTPPNLPVRPLTPPPPPRPPMPQMPQIPQMQKLPSIPARPGMPPIQPAGLPKTESSQPKKGKLIAIVAVSVVILTFIVGEIWWFFLRGETTTTPTQTSEVLPAPQNVEPLLPEGTTPTPVIAEPTLPAPILSYSRSEVIDLETLADVSGLAASDEFVRLVVRAPVAQTTDEAVDATTNSTEYADIAAIAKQLKIRIPTTVSKEFLTDFDVFLFGGNSFDEEECTKARNTTETCFGPRLGIVARVSDPKTAASALKIWEKTMSTDLKPMILARAGSSASANFLTGTYESQSIRYKNMPINTITVEYTLADDILIITTSKNAILKAIDSLPVSTENTTESEIQE